MKQLLDKSSQLSQHAIGILNGFDTRLSTMHTSLTPLHSSTQKLSRVNENVDRLMEQLQTVIEYFDLANGSRAEPQLNEQDFRQFHAEVDRIRQAFLYISSSNLRNGELMRNRLRSILFRAMHKMELLFRKHLSSCSQPTAAGEDGTVDILKLNFPPWPVSSQPQELASPVLAASTSEVSATPLIDAKQIETLRNIAQYLAQNELDMAAHGPAVESSAAADGSTLHSTNYVKVFLEVRSQYLDQIFQPTIKACTKSLEGLGGTGSTSSYSRNSSPFLAFTLGLLYMANHEYRLLQSMLNTAGGQQTLTITGIATAPSLLGASASRSGKRHLMSTTMEQLIGPLLDSYRGCADGILKRFRKGTVQNREYGLQFLALDCLANFVNQMASTRKKKKEEPSAATTATTTGAGGGKSDKLLAAAASTSQSKTVNVRDLGVDWEETFRNCGRRAGDLNAIITEFTVATARSLSEFIEDTQSSTTKSSSLPDDGTVHELTSNAMTYLKRLTEYLDVVEILCHLARSGNEWTANISLGGDDDDIISKLSALRDQSRKILLVWQSELPRSNTAASTTASSAGSNVSATPPKYDVDLFKMTSSRQFYIDCIQALLTNLETKAKNYKKNAVDRAATAAGASAVPSSTVALQQHSAPPKSIQATIFLINNYHYVLRALRSNRLLLMIVGKEFEADLEKKLTAELSFYQQFLQPLIVLLMDTTYIKDGSIVMQMSKSERGQIKDRFKKFNDDFEEFHRLQRRFSVPDTELRARIIAEARSTLLPMYQRFLQKYENTDFSSHKEKYLRFDVETLERMAAQNCNATRQLLYFTLRDNNANMTINTIFPVHIWEEIFLYIDPLEQRRTLQDLPSFVRCLLEVQGSTAFHRCLEHHIYALPIAIKESLMPSTQMSQAESPAVTASIARRTLRQFTEPQLRRLVCWSVDSGYRQTIRLLLANGMDPELLRYPLQRAHTYNDISTKQWIEAMIMNDARPRRSVPELIDTSRLIRQEIECQFNHVNPRNCDLMIRQAIKFGVDLYLLPPSYTLIHPSNIQHVSEMKRLLFEYGLNITMTGLGRNGCCKHNSGYVNKMFLLM